MLVSLSCSFFLYLFIYLFIGNWFKVLIHISYPSTFFFVLCISVVFISYSAISIYIYIHKGKKKRYTQLTCTYHLSSLFSPPDDACHKSWRCRDLLGVTTNRRNGTTVACVHSTAHAFREKNTDQQARDTEWSQINVNQLDHIYYDNICKSIFVKI